METPTGTLTINGIDDSELAKILEIKIKHEAVLSFNPQQIHPRPKNQAGNEQVYNNAAFSWTTEEGMKAVREVISMLLKE